MKVLCWLGWHRWNGADMVNPHGKFLVRYCRRCGKFGGAA